MDGAQHKNGESFSTGFLSMSTVRCTRNATMPGKNLRGVWKNERILSEAHKWKMILARIIHIVVFLGERGLPFRGSSQRIGDIHNGDFLGLIELLAHYDPILQ